MLLDFIGKSLDKLEAFLLGQTASLNAIKPARTPLSEAGQAAARAELEPEPFALGEVRTDAHGRLLHVRSFTETPLMKATPPREWWAKASHVEKTEKRMELRALLGRKGYPEWTSRLERRALLDHHTKHDPQGPYPQGNPRTRVLAARKVLATDLASLSLFDAQRPKGAALESLPPLEQERLRTRDWYLRHEVRRSEQVLSSLRDTHTRPSRRALVERVAALEAQLAHLERPGPPETQKLWALLKKATGLPWTVSKDRPDDVVIWGKGTSLMTSPLIANVGESRVGEVGVAFDIDTHNAELVVAAVNALPGLLAPRRTTFVSDPIGAAENYLRRMEEDRFRHPVKLAVGQIWLGISPSLSDGYHHEVVSIVEHADPHRASVTFRAEDGSLVTVSRHDWDGHHVWMEQEEP